MTHAPNAAEGEGHLPLLSFVSSLNPDADFSDTLLIACQHVLGTQINLFKELFQKGLQPKNLFLIGKSYSTNEKTYQRFVQQGVNISPASKEFDSYISFDEQFQAYIKDFLTDIASRVRLSEYARIIVVDVGGALLSSVDNYLEIDSLPIIGIEQTSSGYERIKDRDFSFPIINVARSHAKQELEPPLIAHLVVEKIRDYFTRSSLAKPSILMVGQGPIGQWTKKLLQQTYSVTGYDIESSRSDFLGDHRDRLLEFDVIIGATGQEIFKPDDISALKNDTHLISISSSDREFPAAYLRKAKPRTNDPHVTVHAKGTYLVNSGFPINFDGGERSLPLSQAQSAVALMLAALYQAKKERLSPGFKELDSGMQDLIIQRFRKLVRDI